MPHPLAEKSVKSYGNRCINQRRRINPAIQAFKQKRAGIAARPLALGYKAVGLETAA
jgi:hypothetical protein